MDLQFTRANRDPANPLAQTVIVDEFTVSSTETGENGELGWSFTNGSFNLIGPETNHPGICRRASSASSGAVASTYTGGGGVTVVVTMEQVDEVTWVIRPVTADTDFDLRFGMFSDMTANPPAAGSYFEKLAADTNWFGVGRLASVQTRVTTGVAFAASWFKLKLRRVSASVVAFSVNGGAEVQVTTNNPSTTGMAFGFQIIPGSANARSVDVDFFSMKLTAQAR